MLHIIIPTDIQSNNLFLGAPSPTPIAAPSGAPNSNGDTSPKPMIPYFLQISYILPCSIDRDPYLHFMNHFLTPSPSVTTKKADTMDPAAAATMIRMGLSFKTNPSGIDSHNSATLAKNTSRIDTNIFKIVSPLSDHIFFAHVPINIDLNIKFSGSNNY